MARTSPESRDVPLPSPPLPVSSRSRALAADDPKDKDKPKGKANRLAKESSPYLLQHAHNPVDWYAWGPEAFERAKKEKKLIFLSIGYSSCHWCHVMERESFCQRGDRQDAERELRLHQGGSRGAAGRGRHLHDRAHASPASRAAGR